MAAWTYTTNSGVEYFDITGVTENRFWDVISTTLDAGHVYSISATTASESNYDGIIISTSPLNQVYSGSLSSAYSGSNIILLCSGTSGSNGTEYTVGSSDQDIYIYFRTDTSTLSPSSEEGHVFITDIGEGGGDDPIDPPSGGDEWDVTNLGSNHYQYSIQVSNHNTFAIQTYTVTNGHTYVISVSANSESGWDGVIVAKSSLSGGYSSMKSNSACIAYASGSNDSMSTTYTATTAGALYIYFVSDGSNLNPNPSSGSVDISEQSTPSPTQSTLNLIGTSVSYGSTAEIRATPNVAGTIHWGYSSSSMPYTKTNCTGGTTYVLTSTSSTGSTTVYAYLDPSSGSYSDSDVVNATMTVAGQSTITITLDRNGGTSGSTSINLVPGCSAANYPVIVIPSRGSFRFDGYYTSKTGGTQYINDEGTGQRTAPTSATTWYAHWYNAIDYNVYGTFTVTESSSSQTITISSTAGSCASGGTITYDIDSIYKNGSGVSTTGWSISSNGKVLTIPASLAQGSYSVTILASSPGVTTGSTYFGDDTECNLTVVVNAQQTITISLSGNGGSGNPSTIQVTPGAAAGAWSVGTLPTRSGFEFIGYYSASTSGTQYTDGSGTTVHAATQTPTILYANWQPTISYTFLDNATEYCTSRAASYDTADGDISVPISSLGVVVPSGVTFTISELFYNFDFSSDGKNVIVPDGTAADEYQLCISIDTSSGSNYRSLLSQVFYAEFRLIAVTKYPNDSNPTKYKNTSGTTGTNTSYGTPTCAIANTGLTAAGGSANVSCSVSDTSTWYWKYTNGVYSSLQSTTVSGTATWAITLQTFTPSGGIATNISRFSKSSNKINHTTMGENVGTDRVLITATNSGDTSKTNTADKYITNESSTTQSIVEYGIPDVYIGSGIFADGGEATVTCSVRNTVRTTTSYTSGSSSYVDETVDGTAKWRITSNGNDAFTASGTSSSLSGVGTVYNSGGEISHEDMGTDERTDTVVVTAYNVGDTSKTATARDVTVNELEWQTPIFTKPGTGSSMSVSLAKAGQTYTIVPTVTQQQTYTSGVIAQTVDVSNNIVYSVSTAKTGYSLNTSTHVVTVTNNESTSARNGFKVLLKCTGNGNVVKNFTMTFNQAAGSQAYLNPVITGFTYDTFAAGGATKTPTVTYYQDYAWNGVAGSGTRTENTGGTLAFGDMGITFPTGFSKGSNYATTGSVTWANRTNVEGAARDCNNYLSVTVTMNSKTSNPFWCTSCVQEANSLGTQHYQNTSGTTGDVTTYGTPTCILNTTNLTAGGGSYYVACDVNNTVKYYRRYTSGTYTSQYSDTQAGTAKWKISSQTCAGGGTRFSNPTSGSSSLSGVGTVYTGGSGHPGAHSTMGTNEGTDTINVISYNVADITKTNTATGSVSNPITWNNISLTVSSPATPYSMAVSGETVSISASATQSGSYASGSPATGTVTIGYAVQTSKTGYSLSSNNVTVTNNTSTSARNGFVVRITATGSGSKTATSDRTFNQAAGAKSYSNPSITAYTYSTTANTGATDVAPTVTYSQSYTWNGVSGSGGTITSGGTLAFTCGTGTPDRFSTGTNFATTGKITWGNNNTTSAKDAKSKLSVTVTLNSKTSSAYTCTACSQSAGAKTYSTPTVNTFSYATYAASGATKSPSVTYSMPYTWNGVSADSGTDTSGGTLTYSKGTLTSGATADSSYSSNGKITWANNTSTSQRSTHSVLTVTVKTPTGNLTSSAKTCTACTQSAGAKVYETPTVSGSYTYATAAASGTTDATPNALPSYSQVWTWNGVSGSGGTLTSGQTVTYNYSTTGTLPTGFSTGTNFATTGKIKWANNTTTSSRAAASNLKVTLTINGKTSAATTCTACTQSAGAKSYANPSITAYTYATTANTGATDVTPTVTYSQVWTWNGVSGSGGTITSGGTLAFTCASGTPNRFSTGTNFSTTGKVTWGNNNTASAKDAKAKLTVTVTLNSKTSSSYTCTACSQSAGAKAYGTPSITAFSYATFAAAGATKTPTVTYNLPYTWNGVSADSGTDTSGGTLAYAKGTLTSGATAASNYATTGSITWANNTTTSARSTHSVLTVTVTSPTGNKTSSAYTCTACTQSAGAKVYETPTLSGSYTYATAAAAGVTDAAPNALPTYSQVWTWNGVSGSGGTLTSGQTVTYNYTAGTLPTGFTKGTNFATTGKINWSNNNSTSTRTATSILSVTLTINGKTSASKACTACTQSAGAKVYSNPTVTAYTYSTSVSAAGTTDLAPASLTYSQTWTWNGVSGSGGTITSGGTLAFTRATTYSWMTAGTNFATTGKINVASLGTTISNARTFAGALSVTVTLNGKTSSSTTATAGKQNGNYVVSIVTGDSSGGTGNHFSYSNIGAGATSASPSFTGGATYTFTSGDTKFDSSGSPSFGGSASYTRSFSLGTVQNGFTAVNSTSGVLTATSRGTTPGDARTSGTVTGTLVVKYTHASSYSAGGTVTAPTYTSTATCTQAANALTGLAISVGTNPINYGGTSTCTVTATYTSGATKNVDCDTNTTYSFNPTGIVTVTKS